MSIWVLRKVLVGEFQSEMLSSKGFDTFYSSVYRKANFHGVSQVTSWPTSNFDRVLIIYALAGYGGMSIRYSMTPNQEAIFPASNESFRCLSWGQHSWIPQGPDAEAVSGCRDVPLPPPPNLNSASPWILTWAAKGRFIHAGATGFSWADTSLAHTLERIGNCPCVLQRGFILSSYKIMRRMKFLWQLCVFNLY